MYEGGLRQNFEYRALARKQLKGKWGMAALFIFISNCFASLFSILLSGPTSYGTATYFMKITRSEEPLLEDMFGGFKYFINTFLLYLVTWLFTTLWSLLFIIPGIVAALRYSMAYYIMNDNPGISAMEAINQSKEMMKGHKGKLFLLNLSFIGWGFLSVSFTFGIGLLWVGAYFNTAKINFYEDLKRNNNMNSSYEKN